jgi:hypothetical protein
MLRGQLRKLRSNGALFQWVTLNVVTVLPALLVTGPIHAGLACRWVDWQRRTGAPFDVGAFYPAEVATI